QPLVLMRGRIGLAGGATRLTKFEFQTSRVGCERADDEPFKQRSSPQWADSGNDFRFAPYVGRKGCRSGCLNADIALYGRMVFSRAPSAADLFPKAPGPTDHSRRELVNLRQLAVVSS